MAISLDLRWFKVMGNKSYPVSPKIVNRNGSFGKEIAVLVFTNITKQDEGLYQCRRKTNRYYVRCGKKCDIPYFSIWFPSIYKAGMPEYRIRQTAFQLNVKGNFQVFNVTYIKFNVTYVQRKT